MIDILGHAEANRASVLWPWLSPFPKWMGSCDSMKMRIYVKSLFSAQLIGAFWAEFRESLFKMTSL